ncbi:hypothetical protein NPIL_110561 [Nephila pilipes]|uniref:Uncharacterized protein n=1 Tax=Nephila pilipes TaxID=299642 RepID=A0A8X6P5K6_NEPPI|nr:hypothetical protein NPIL_110561 [Nephila pilipes]
MQTIDIRSNKEALFGRTISMTPIKAEIKSEAHQPTGTVIAFGVQWEKVDSVKVLSPPISHPSIAFKGLGLGINPGRRGKRLKRKLSCILL